jgi:hypothetical protein
VPLFKGGFIVKARIRDTPFIAGVAFLFLRRSRGIANTPTTLYKEGFFYRVCDVVWRQEVTKWLIAN